ncbi:glycerol acyltransferase [Hallella colorans]|uniref:glycerol acyltransferase n=1 Tax=Hallella colorans TaxID=1703337 RepID=UPI0023F18870|nr:glycerol acyltransferase [Hallella colorans]
MVQNVQKTIDIEKVLRSKMGGKVKYVPRFVINWLKRLAHEDEVNAFLWENRDKEGTSWLEACVKYLDMDISIEGEENLPDKHDGKLYTFVSNHPLGGQDGVCLGAIIGRRYDGKFRYLVNDLLMFLPGLRPVCIGINKTGRQARDFPRMVEMGFQSDNHILMFPAGLNSRLIGGRIHDLPWKKTFVTKSVQYQRDVVPIYFSGRNSKRFYRIAKWQKIIGLKVNIAMLFLVDEMYKNRHKHFRVVVGKPIPWQTFDNRKKTVEWAKYVEDRVYEQAGTLGLRAE